MKGKRYDLILGSGKGAIKVVDVTQRTIALVGGKGSGKHGLKDHDKGA